MARVRLVEEDPEDPDLRDTFRKIAQVEGLVPHHFRAEMNFPELLKALLNVTMTVWQQGEIDLPTILYVGAAVSKDNGCQYCVGAWGTWLTRAADQDPEQVSAFIRDGDAPGLDDRQRALVAFARKVNARWREVTEEDVEGLRRLGLSDRGLVQLVHAVSNFGAYNRFNVALGVSPDHYDYDARWARAFRGEDGA